MTRPWVAVEAAIRVNHKLVALPNDSARWGWICLLGEAKQQRPAGSFRSASHLREAAGRFARFIPKYTEQHLLEIAPALCPRCHKRWPGVPEGTVVVHDWHAHQRDPGAADRAKDWRDNAERTDDEREPYEKRTRGDTDHSRALSLSMSTSDQPDEESGYQVPRASDDLWSVVQVVEDLIGPFGYSRGSPVFEKLAADVASCGVERVVTTYRALRSEYSTEPMDAAQLVYGGHKRLFPIPDAPRQGKAAAAPKGMVQPVDEIREALRAQ